jgi:hypothetical protein
MVPDKLGTKEDEFLHQGLIKEKEKKVSNKMKRSTTKSKEENEESPYALNSFLYKKGRNKQLTLSRRGVAEPPD